MVLKPLVRNLAASAIGRVVVVATVLGATGIAGYVVIEGWSVLDAAFMTVLTFTTVGSHGCGPR